MTYPKLTLTAHNVCFDYKQNKQRKHLEVTCMTGILYDLWIEHSAGEMTLHNAWGRGGCMRAGKPRFVQLTTFLVFV